MPEINIAPAEGAPQTLPPVGAARYLGVSRTTLFELLRDGEIKSILIGARQRRIPIAELDAFLERKLEEQAPKPRIQAAR